VHALNHFTERLRESSSSARRSSSPMPPTSCARRWPRSRRGSNWACAHSSPKQWRQTLESAAQGTDRLTHLANQLLSLARVENGARAIAEAARSAWT
jgi:two-component system sensor histidine kinase TctE